MPLSLDALQAFAHAAELGSISAAARALGKRQSTLSEAIANLEIDLGITLLDRSRRLPTLTDAGHTTLAYAHDVLSAVDRLTRHARQLSQGLEARLTLAVSDTIHADRLEPLFSDIDQRFPGLELEYLVAEDHDLVGLVQSGRAQIGLTMAQADYPADVGHATLADPAELGIFVAREHPLATLAPLREADLSRFRELRLSSWDSPSQTPSHPRPRIAVTGWSSPDYLTLLDMASQGFGWAVLPRAIAKRFRRDELLELCMPGWPRQVAIDALWKRDGEPGRAGAWLLTQLQSAHAPQ